MIRLLIPFLLAVWTAPVPPAGADVQDIPPQTFTLDPVHATVVFSVNHLGLSAFTAGFDDVSATLELDPGQPETASLTATIAVRSLNIPAPESAFYKTLMRAPWFDADNHPEMSFVSDMVDLTDPVSARIVGTLSLNGITAPLTLNARFNGSYPAQFIEQNARIGFSAEGHIDRSEFGMAFGQPAEGSKLGVGDRVTFRIEAEFIGTLATD